MIALYCAEDMGEPADEEVDELSLELGEEAQDIEESGDLDPLLKSW